MWEPGRQGTGYLKRLLWQGSIFDVWLLKYAAGDAIPRHVDAIPGHRHFRFNVLLYGEDALKTTHALFRFGPFVLFRSDRIHSVEATTRPRLVLSIGVATKERL